MSAHTNVTTCSTSDYFERTKSVSCLNVYTRACVCVCVWLRKSACGEIRNHENLLHVESLLEIYNRG